MESFISVVHCSVDDVLQSVSVIVGGHCNKHADDRLCDVSGKLFHQHLCQHELPQLTQEIHLINVDNFTFIILFFI